MNKKYLVAAVFIGACVLFVLTLKDRASNLAVGPNEHRHETSAGESNYKTKEKDTFEGEVAPIARSSSPIPKAENSESIKLPSPLEVYQSAIKEANKGSPRHQFLVADALSKCSDWDKIPDDEYWRNLESMVAMDEKELLSHRKQAIRCDPLFKEIAPQNPRELMQAWMAEAAENGDIYAQLYQVTMGPYVTSSEKLLPLVRQGIIEAKGDPELLSKAATAGSLLFAKIRREAIKSGASKYDYEAVNVTKESQSWELYSCQLSIECPETELIEVFRTVYPKYEVEDRINRAKQIESIIDGGNMEELFELAAN